ncbi:Uncharacterised protein [Mycobacteroides abscessus subsp. abscessus]|nr:Uncharacterised protein [Mycobacteroides abscessus subsp. abscessus]
MTELLRFTTSFPHCTAAMSSRTVVSNPPCVRAPASDSAPVESDSFPCVP